MKIVVNGGTRGIGKAVVIHLANNKENQIIVTGRNSTSLQQLSAEHNNVQPFVMDLSESKSGFAGYRDFISSTLGSIDILINVAAVMINKRFLEISDQEARRIIETNFFGPATAIKVLQPLMQKGSHIVNISSMGGYQGTSKYPGLSYYSASKAALAILTECLAVEFRELGIKVNCLALGSVQTEMFNEAFPGHKASVTTEDMGGFIAEFALTGHKVFNGKILPVAISNP